MYNYVGNFRSIMPYHILFRIDKHSIMTSMQQHTRYYWVHIDKDFPPCCLLLTKQLGGGSYRGRNMRVPPRLYCIHCIPKQINGCTKHTRITFHIHLLYNEYTLLVVFFRTVSVISGEGVPETNWLTRGIFGGCNGLFKVSKHSIFDHIFIIKEA